MKRAGLPSSSAISPTSGILFASSFLRRLTDSGLQFVRRNDLHEQVIRLPVSLFLIIIWSPDLRTRYPFTSLSPSLSLPLVLTVESLRDEGIARTRRSRYAE